MSFQSLNKFDNPNNKEDQVWSNDGEEENVFSLLIHVEVSTWIEVRAILVNLRDEEKPAINRQNLCCQRYVFNFIESPFSKGSHCRIKTHENYQKDKQN